MAGASSDRVLNLEPNNAERRQVIGARQKLIEARHGLLALAEEVRNVLGLEAGGYQRQPFLCEVKTAYEKFGVDRLTAPLVLGDLSGIRLPPRPPPPRQHPGLIESGITCRTAIAMV